MKIDTQTKQRIFQFSVKYPWITQKDLADLFQVSAATISNIVRGK